MNISNISIKAVTGKLNLYFNTNLTLRKYSFTPPCILGTLAGFPAAGVATFEDVEAVGEL